MDFSEEEILDTSLDDIGFCEFVYKRRKGDYRKGDHCEEEALPGEQYCKEHLKQSRKRKRKEKNTQPNKSSKIDLTKDLLKRMDVPPNSTNSNNKKNPSLNEVQDITPPSDYLDNNINLNEVLPGTTDEMIRDFYCKIIERFELAAHAKTDKIDFRGSAARLKKNPLLLKCFHEMFKKINFADRELNPFTGMVAITLITMITTAFSSKMDLKAIEEEKYNNNNQEEENTPESV